MHFWKILINTRTGIKRNSFRQEGVYPCNRKSAICPALASSSNNDQKSKINTIILNNDGRSDQALIEGENFKEGKYELIFFIGDYFKEITNIPKIPFLDDVVVKFGISNIKEHYHVPLLVSPWSYSTYRGS